MSYQRPNRFALIVDSLEAIGRSWWTLVGGACMSVALVFAALSFLPKNFDANAKIRVDLSQLEASGEQATDAALAAIHREITESLGSRSSLLEALTAAEVEPEDSPALELAINEARRSLELSGPSAQGIVELVYTHSDPTSASRVVNALADGFVERKSANRPTLDANAVEQLELAMSGLRPRLESARENVAAFNTEHPHASPEHRSTNMKMLSARRQDLTANRAAASAAEERLGTLSNQGPRLETLAKECVAQSSSGSAKLLELDGQLESLTPGSPSSTAKVQELEALLVSYEPTREELRAHRRCNAEAGKLVDVVAPTADEIARTRSEIERLSTERAEIQSDVAVYEQRLEAIPLLEQQRTAVLTAYDLLLAEYKDYESRLFEARRQRDASRAELAGMFEVTEKSAEGGMPGGAPSWGVILGGLGIGFLIFVGPVTVRGFLFPAVTSEAGLAAISTVPVLVSIPELPAHEVVEADRRRMLKNIAFSLMMVVVTLAWIVMIHKGL